ncbi:uncharacterized protein PHALS_15086 [Plasmopara halstedii]|uniref:Uncharacterized protein n=1 Tax=Plasmopara halstedii TaxID=4781 RepID=A0A0P1AZS9_PLAHL|nr:uncharacterized protein PHALS_15086 [Plasmopara halstedii]CEG47885.1 hypothetical protein PHALS_15086 [Plasmopara halstedii]|eukprot:XP_024584254.1 hypothetical protein PHALS_15086 [Plasmopara halstedii]
MQLNSSMKALTRLMQDKEGNAVHLEQAVRVGSNGGSAYVSCFLSSTDSNKKCCLCRFTLLMSSIRQ